MQCPCSLSAGRVAMGRKRRVEKGDIPEGDITGRHIVIVGILRLDGFVTLYPYIIFRAQVFKYHTRHGVFLKTGDFCIGSGFSKAVGKCTRPGAGVYRPERCNAALL
ncbi:hypothetical protein DSECCO2_548790 [anaerobic digester metagenome]